MSQFWETKLWDLFDPVVSQKKKKKIMVWLFIIHVRGHNKNHSNGSWGSQSKINLGSNELSISAKFRKANN